jgi:radical SAM protein with 4Fe4S-binding SPASM domain
MTDMPHFRRLVERATRELIPLDVSLELTWRCNFRCHHCYIPDFHAPDGVSTPRLLELLEELAAMGTLFLTLTGGEPLLRRDWEVVIRRARELGFQVTLLTNGSLVDECVSDILAELAVQVQVSFHSSDPVVFDRVTARTGSAARVLEGVERLRDRGVSVELTVPISRLNPDGAAGVPLLADAIGVETRVYTTIFAAKDGGRTPLALRLPARDAVRLAGAPGTGCHLPDEAAEHPAGDGPLCAAGVRYANITAAGDVLACNILPGRAGNINHASFREIWERSARLQRIRAIRRSDLPVCSICSKLPYCGRCHAQALAEDGDILGPSSAACAHATALEDAARRGA